MSGRVELDADSEVQVEGTLRLHGADHPMTLTLPVQAKGANLSIRTHIAIPYVAWGLKSPSTFLLHVSETVDIEITAAGEVRGQGTPPPQTH